MSQVERIRLIARGRSSTVVLAKLHPKNNADAPILVAIKSSCPSIIEHEREILYHLEGCPQVIQSIDDNDHNTSEDLLLEYSSQGSLRKLLSSSGPLPERQVRLLTASILKGLAYIHKNGYVHCDLKPENLLLCSPTDIKIADFGFAKRAGEKSRGTTITYMAPECVIRDQYEAPMDVWALGCIVVEMLTRKIALKFDPYVKGITGLLNDIREGKAYPQIPTMTRLSEDGKDFLGKCFVREPKMRWTAEMLLEHPFVVGGGDDLEVEDDRKGGYFRYAGKLLGIFSRCLLSSD